MSLLLTLFLLAATLLQAADTMALLPNGDFETPDAAGTFAADWRPGRYDGAAGDILIDETVRFSGRRALRLTQTGTQGWMAANAAIRLAQPLPADRNGTLRLRVMGADVQAAQVVFTAGPASKPQALWKSLELFKGSFEWKECRYALTVPAGSQTLTVSLRSSGPGTVWFDDCQLELENPPEAAEVAAPAGGGGELVRNGEVAGPADPATGLPAGWQQKMYHGLEAIGTVGLSADGWQSADALQLAYHSGARRFGAEAELLPPPPGAARYRASARIITAGGGKALLAVAQFNASGSQTEELFSPPLSGDTWQELVFEFSTRPDMASFKLFCLSGETGTVLFDRVSCRFLEGVADAGAFPLEAQLYPVDWNKLWNQGQADFHTFADAPIPFAFHFKGERGKLRNPEVVIDAPASLLFSGAFTIHTNNYRRETPDIETLERPDGSYRRYRFRAVKAFDILQNSYGWGRKMAVLFEPADPAAVPAAGSRSRIYWHLRQDGRSAPEQSFEFVVNPPLPNAPRPQNFRVMRWSTYDYNFPDDAPLERALAVLERAGLDIGNSFGASFPRAAELTTLMRRRGWTLNSGTPDYTHPQFLPKAELAALPNPPEYIVRANGKTDESRICPDYFVADPGMAALFRRHFRQVVADKNLQPGDFIMLDFEPWGTLDWCFCERSRRAFAAWQKLDTVPDTATIKNSHAFAWSRFRCENTAAITRICHEVMQEFPGIALTDYDYIVDFSRPDYQNAFFSVAKDSELNETYFDTHYSSYYHVLDKKAFDMIRINTRHLKKGYVPICAIDGLGYLTANEILSPAQARLMLMGGAALGCSGFAIYPGPHLDGRFLSAFARCQRELAVLEPYYRNGRQDAPGVSVEAKPYQTMQIMVGDQPKTLSFPLWREHMAWTAVPAGQERLVTLLNYHPEQVLYASVQVDMPETGAYTVLQPVSRKRLLPRDGAPHWTAAELREGLLCPVRPRDLDVVLVRPAAAGDDALPVLSWRTEVVKAFEARAAAYRQQALLAPKRAGNLSLQLSDSDDDGIPELQIASPLQTLHLDYLRGARIINWQVRGQPLAGIFNVDQVWLPKEARSHETEAAEITSYGIENGVATVTATRNLALLPLRVEKQLSIDAVSSAVSLRLRYHNIGAAPVSFSVWMRQQNTDAAPWQFLLGGGANRQELAERTGDPVYALPDVSPEGFAPDKVQPLRHGTASAIRIGGITLATELPAAELANYYYWLSPAVSTWEWMYRRQTLAPGESWETSYTLQAE